jgi:hypothetical protein
MKDVIKYTIWKGCDHCSTFSLIMLTPFSMASYVSDGLMSNGKFDLKKFRMLGIAGKKRMNSTAMVTFAELTISKHSIIERLTALGWGDEIDKIPGDDLESHRLVRAPQQLTERSKLFPLHSA